MARFSALLPLVFVLAACGTQSPAAPQPGDAARGALLYDTACVQCHTAQPHWRDKRVAGSWELLVSEVTRWQHAAGQRWGEGEIRDVAAYLNERFYKLPAPGRS